MFGVEPIVYSNPELVLPLSEKWIKDKNKWIRRFGVVTLRGYKKVQITKRNPDDVAEFLTRWAKANPGNDARWIIKDGMKKLPEEKRTKILAIISG